MSPPTVEHPHGQVEKWRYRCTIAAFKHMVKQGIDYDHKDASTVKWNSLLILLAWACKNNQDISLIDISTFFLYGTLDKPMYMEQPEGWVVEGKPAKEWVCKVNKSMYGLPQAPRCAQLKLKDTLKKGGFRSTLVDDCVHYLLGKGLDTASKGELEELLVAAGIHVDDSTVVGTPETIALFREALKREFEITEKYNPSCILGVEIERKREELWMKLHQTTYIKRMVEEYGYMDAVGADTPIDPELLKTVMELPVDEVPDKQVLEEYQQFAGKLIWLRTRPDMLFATNVVSRFLQCATRRHLELLKDRILRYLCKYPSLGLVFYPGQEEWILSGYSDADLAGDYPSARTTMGHMLKIGQYGTIAATCGLERKIMTSTVHAETYAFHSMTKNALWVKELMYELKMGGLEPTPLFTDNEGVVKHSTKAVNHTKAKHFRIAQAFIRQQQDNEVIDAGHVGSQNNPADMFTKPLNRVTLGKHRDVVMGPWQDGPP